MAGYSYAKLNENRKEIQRFTYHLKLAWLTKTIKFNTAYRGEIKINYSWTYEFYGNCVLIDNGGKTTLYANCQLTNSKCCYGTFHLQLY